jgi:hypothetical protein
MGFQGNSKNIFVAYFAENCTGAIQQADLKAMKSTRNQSVHGKNIKN